MICLGECWILVYVCGVSDNLVLLCFGGVFFMFEICFEVGVDSGECDLLDSLE